MNADIIFLNLPEQTVNNVPFLLFTECSVSVYGSSFTGFGLKESDINLDLVIPEEVS